jgi:hypothetical protein
LVWLVLEWASLLGGGSPQLIAYPFSRYYE